jgi:hypothetical protein
MTLSFTPKEPGAFAGKNGCAVHFFSHVNSASNTAVPIWFTLNNASNWRGCYIPGVTGIGNWQSVDVSFVHSPDFSILL